MQWQYTEDYLQSHKEMEEERQKLAQEILKEAEEGQLHQTTTSVVELQKPKKQKPEKEGDEKKEEEQPKAKHHHHHKQHKDQAQGSPPPRKGAGEIEKQLAREEKAKILRERQQFEGALNVAPQQPAPAPPPSASATEEGGIKVPTPPVNRPASSGGGGRSTSVNGSNYPSPMATAAPPPPPPQLTTGGGAYPRIAGMHYRVGLYKPSGSSNSRTSSASLRATSSSLQRKAMTTTTGGSRSNSVDNENNNNNGMGSMQISTASFLGDTQKELRKDIQSLRQEVDSWESAEVERSKALITASTQANPEREKKNTVALDFSASVHARGHHQTQIGGLAWRNSFVGKKKRKAPLVAAVYQGELVEEEEEGVPSSVIAPPNTDDDTTTTESSTATSSVVVAANSQTNYTSIITSNLKSMNNSDSKKVEEDGIISLHPQQIWEYTNVWRVKRYVPPAASNPFTLPNDEDNDVGKNSSPKKSARRYVSLSSIKKEKEKDAFGDDMQDDEDEEDGAVAPTYRAILPLDVLGVCSLVTEGHGDRQLHERLDATWALSLVKMLGLVGVGNFCGGENEDDDDELDYFSHNEMDFYAEICSKLTIPPSLSSNVTGGGFLNGSSILNGSTAAPAMRKGAAAPDDLVLVPKKAAVNTTTNNSTPASIIVLPLEQMTTPLLRNILLMLRDVDGGSSNQGQETQRVHLEAVVLVGNEKLLVGSSSNSAGGNNSSSVSVSVSKPLLVIGPQVASILIKASIRLYDVKMLNLIEARLLQPPAAGGGSASVHRELQKHFREMIMQSCDELHFLPAGSIGGTVGGGSSTASSASFGVSFSAAETTIGYNKQRQALEEEGGGGNGEAPPAISQRDLIVHKDFWDRLDSRYPRCFSARFGRARLMAAKIFKVKN